jgi:hypothetical protein
LPENAPESRQRTIVAAIAAVLVLLVAMSPTILFSRPPSALGLVLTGAVLTGAGLLLRRGRGAGLRTTGTALAILGAALVAFGAGLIVLLLAG